jgi:hypothetical protein
MSMVDLRRAQHNRTWATGVADSNHAFVGLMDENGAVTGFVLFDREGIQKLQDGLKHASEFLASFEPVVAGHA